MDTLNTTPDMHSYLEDTVDGAIASLDYEEHRIRHNEWAEPEVLNRALVAAINSDARLEAGLQYTVRSSAFYVTDNTRFLSHCAARGTDDIGKITPLLTGTAADIFYYDNKFKSSAWAQDSVYNKLTTSDTRLTSLNGWTEAQGDQKVSVDAPTYGYSGIVISNINQEGSARPGFFGYMSDIIDCSSGETLSVSMLVSSDYNLQQLYTEGYVGIQFYTASNVPLSTDPAMPVTLGYLSSMTGDKLTGRLVLENVVPPEFADHCRVSFGVKYRDFTSKAKVAFQNVLIESGGVAHPYVNTFRTPCTAMFPRVVTQGNVATAMCWARFKPYALKMHVNPIGPFFLVNEALTTSIGGVHRSKDQSKLVLCLQLIKDGEIQYGNDIVIPDKYIDKYMLTTVRMRADGPDLVAELVVIVGKDVLISSLTIPAMSIPNMHMYVGSNTLNADYFSGPVTELRYDSEWINDVELIMISLTQKIFSTQDSEVQLPTNIGDYLESVGVNLIVNPEGRLDMFGWTGYDPKVFGAVVKDSIIGSGFLFGSAAAITAKNYVYSLYINIDPSQVYSLRLRSAADSSSTGDHGVGIAFYDSNKDLIGSHTLFSLPTNSPDATYTFDSIAPPSNALYCRVIMYQEKGYKSSRTTYGKLKLELNYSTMFTDDTGSNFAVYGESNSTLPGPLPYLNFNNKSEFPAVGATGTLYVELSTNTRYTWDGSKYIVYKYITGSQAYLEDNVVVPGKTIVKDMHVKEIRDRIQRVVNELDGHIGSRSSAAHGFVSSTTAGFATPALLERMSNIESAMERLATEVTSSLPIGIIVPWLSETPPEGWVAVRGGLLREDTYPDLYAYAERSGKVTTEANWWNIANSQAGNVGYFAHGPMAGSVRQLRMPNITCYMSGNTNKGICNFGYDAIRDITGDFAGGYVYTGGYRPTNWYTGAFAFKGEGYGSDSGPDKLSTATFAASRVVPTAEENRPMTIYVMYIMKAYNTEVKTPAAAPMSLRSFSLDYTANDSNSSGPDDTIPGMDPSTIADVISPPDTTFPVGYSNSFNTPQQMSATYASSSVKCTTGVLFHGMSVKAIVPEGFTWDQCTYFVSYHHSGTEDYIRNLHCYINDDMTLEVTQNGDVHGYANILAIGVQ